MTTIKPQKYRAGWEAQGVAQGANKWVVQEMDFDFGEILMKK